MADPTVTEIRALSQVDFATRGYPEVDPEEDALQAPLDQAIAYVESVTARDFDAAQPAGYDKLMVQAVRMRTEQIVFESQDEQAETAGDIDLVSTFSAGPYSETRRDTTTAKPPTTLNPWPALERVLWLLLTLAPGETNDAVDERRSYWKAELGRAPNDPAWAVVEVGWGDHYLPGEGGYSAPDAGGAGKLVYGDKETSLYPVEE